MADEKTPDQIWKDAEDETIKVIGQWVSDGEALLKNEPAYDQIDKCIAYIMGDQLDPQRPTSLANVKINRTQHVLNMTVAALTDIHPVFGFKTFNPRFQPTSDVLDKLTRSWWVNTFADLKLADTLKYSGGLGTGYAEIAWNPRASSGRGDIEIVPLDPRDVIPIEPTNESSVQGWGGVILRSRKTVGELRSAFPDKAGRIRADNEPSVTMRTWTRAARAMSRVITPSAVDVLTQGQAKNLPTKVPSVEIRRCFFWDRRLYTGEVPILMGEPGTSWSYTVYPIGYDKVPNGVDEQGQPKFKKAELSDSRLFPRGRYIIASKTCVLYDGPNPYWHGKLPICKIVLNPWPWSFLGHGIVHDLMPLQDMINEIVNGVLDHVRKILRPAVVGDKKIMPNSEWSRLDTRLAGLKFKTNQAAGKTLELVSPDDLPTVVKDLLTFAIQQMDELSGAVNLTQLSQLQQTPGADSIDRMMEALTPILRMKGRLMEAFLREVGEMVMSNFFQFYNMARRVSILGEQGVVMEDFDFDPGTLVPAFSQGEDGYVPELDTRLQRAQRAQWYQKNFTFQITPNSLLAISQMSRKMLYMALFRMGLCDPWTLWEVLEIPSAGSPPGDVITITDRMQAATLMGLTGIVSPVGRKASGQEPPNMQIKSNEDGTPRVTSSESGGGGPGGGNS